MSVEEKDFAGTAAVGGDEKSFIRQQCAKRSHA